MAGTEAAGFPSVFQTAAHPVDRTRRAQPLPPHHLDRRLRGHRRQQYVVLVEDGEDPLRILGLLLPGALDERPIERALSRKAARAALEALRMRHA
jgi:hypothetical protein